MEGVHCAFCDTYIELLAAIYQLRELLQENRKVNRRNGSQCRFFFLVRIIL